MKTGSFIQIKSNTHTGNCQRCGRVSEVLLPSLRWMLSWFICSVNSFSSIVSVLGTDSEKRRLKFFILFISQCPELLKRQEQAVFWFTAAEQHGDGPSLTLCLRCQIILIINKVLVQPTVIFCLAINFERVKSFPNLNERPCSAEVSMFSRMEIDFDIFTSTSCFQQAVDAHLNTVRLH